MVKVKMLKPKLEKEELKRLDFNKSEYEYFIENCNFTDRQLEILNLRRRGKTIIEISFTTHLSERTINREIKRIKNKILKEI
jgi:DNA-binding NarL/FixJ family response regulator